MSLNGRIKEKLVVDFGSRDAQDREVKGIVDPRPKSLREKLAAAERSAEANAVSASDAMLF